jgi:pyruvate dehydrogenase E1 component alpha subunit
MIEDWRNRDGYGVRVEQLGNDDLVSLYSDMIRVREFEDRVHRSFLVGLVHGTTHLCQGQEAVSAGVMQALRPDDYITYTYRGHGQCIARGMSLEGAFAELFGRTTGVSHGLGGSMHMTDHELGLIGSFGIVGAGLPFAVGAALSSQIRDEGQVSATFFGDGATNIGAFHESLNLAAIWSLPVLFVCENNLYGEYTRINLSTPLEDLAYRAAAYDMPGIIVDGNDVLSVYDAAGKAVERARAGGGPTLLECKTYRQRGHSRTDPAAYRSDAEVQEWLARDPLVLFQAVLAERGVMSESDAEGLVRKIRDEVADAAKAASEGDWPDEELAALATYA